MAKLFTPFLIEINIELMQELSYIENNLVNSLKKDFKFKQIEITEDSIVLNDSFPVMKITFEKNSFSITTVVFNDSIEELTELILKIQSQLDIKYTKIISIVLVSLFKVVDINKLISFNLTSNKILNFDFKFEFLDELDLINLKLTSGPEDKNNYAVMTLKTPFEIKTTEITEGLIDKIHHLKQRITCLIDEKGEGIIFDEGLKKGGEEDAGIKQL